MKHKLSEVILNRVHLSRLSDSSIKSSKDEITVVHDTSFKSSSTHAYEGKPVGDIVLEVFITLKSASSIKDRLAPLLRFKNELGDYTLRRVSCTDDSLDMVSFYFDRSIVFICTGIRVSAVETLRL